MKSQIVIIGDIHGCIEELQELLTLLPKGCHIVFAGDLVDRGPDSPGVVKLVRSLPNARVVRGNHDDRNGRYGRRVNKAEAQGQSIAPHSRTDVNRTIAALTHDEREWLAELPRFVKLPDHNAVVVHAGIPGTVQTLPDNIRCLSKNKQREYDTLLYVRYVTDDEQGKMVGKVFSPRPGLIHWTQHYDGRFGHVYYGHEPYFQPQPKYSQHATGIDLACPFGGWLCGVVLEDGVQVDTITVRAKATYSNKYRGATPLV